MTVKAPSYSARCKHCGRVLGTAARIADAELACLRQHARRCFPDDAPADEADAGEVLRHFTVESEP